MNKGKLAVTCRDCGKIRYVSHVELNRAARVRCLLCGGPVEMSQEGREKLAEGRAAQELQRDILQKKQS